MIMLFSSYYILEKISIVTAQNIFPSRCRSFSIRAIVLYIEEVQINILHKYKILREVEREN